MTDHTTEEARVADQGLRLVGLVVRAPDGSTSEPIDLHVPPGTSAELPGGPDGVPTAVLRVVAGLDAAVRGRVELPAGGTGLVTRQHELIGSLTAAENVAVSLMARGGRVPDWADIESVLDRLGVPEASHHNLLEQLSGGQQQRVAVARALIGQPAVLCLDDPTSELDPAGAALVWAQVDEARRAGACVLTTAVVEG
ncbi:ATP-binding cassette domain-containing protein [Frigoribacterium sp. 2-23]|uniref:ATP-binding cassette domain-containing protein n=1 Tax=Frigoribacterium sp. 2-23 TaxID=3415006 RepID=UPI003C702C00